MVASATVNAQGGKTKPGDFMPTFGVESDQAAEFIDPATIDDDAIHRKVIRANAAFGGK
jgi:hypothetical protein